MNKTIIPLGYNLKNRVREIVREVNGRISNWREPVAHTDDDCVGKYLTHDLGRYSRRCRYTHYEYSPICPSYGIISENGNSVSGKIVAEDFTLTAPKGYIFATDSLGIKLQSKTNPKKDFHFNSDHVTFGGISFILKELRSNWDKHRTAYRAAVQQKYFDKIFQREIGSTLVNLGDSRRAGNCIEGTLAWVEKKLGIERKTVLENDYLFSVPAKRLLPLAQEDYRVNNAIKSAWNRETMVMI